jgi:hypothetical protein
LGKAYAVTVILISWTISSYFGIFNIESKFWPFIVYAVRLCGLVLLSQSASSREIAMLFVFVGCMIPYLDEFFYWLRYSGLLIDSYRQQRTRKYISTAELDRRTKSTTERELKKLQIALRKNPLLLHRTNDKLFEGNKNREIDLLNRFVSGNYPGLPYTGKDEVDDDEDRAVGKPRFVTYILYFFIMVAIVCLLKYGRHYLAR